MENIVGYVKDNVLFLGRHCQVLVVANLSQLSRGQRIHWAVVVPQ